MDKDGRLNMNNYQRELKEFLVNHPKYDKRSFLAEAIGYLRDSITKECPKHGCLYFDKCEFKEIDCAFNENELTIIVKFEMGSTSDNCPKCGKQLNVSGMDFDRIY